MSSDSEGLRESESHKGQVENAHDYYTRPDREHSGSPKIAGKHSHWLNEGMVGSSTENLINDYEPAEQPIDIYIDAYSH
jgi:hypothetical protein